MCDNPLASILDMDGEERYDYFLDAVVEVRELWILVNGDNQFLKIVSEEDGVGYLPVWPAEGFAADYAAASQYSQLVIVISAFNQLNLVTRSN